MRKTNAERWAEYQDIIDKKLEVLMLTNYKGIVPEKIMFVSPNGMIEHWRVDAIKYREPKMNTWYSGKKPTNLDVIKIELLSKFEPVYNEANIYFRIVQVKSIYNASQGITLEELKKPNVFTDEAEAIKASNELVEKRKAEDKLLTSGSHVRCDRCRKIVPRSESVTGEITFRTRNHRDKPTLGRSILTFCSNDCWAHEQWAHEG